LEELFAHPAIQGGIAPFIVAFVIALIFMRINVFAGLAVVAGFITMVLLTTGFSFSPMTSTRKLTLLVLLVPVIAFLLQISHKYTDTVLKACYGLAGLAMIWILWPVIMRTPVSEIILPVISYVVYAAWMMGMFMRMSELPAATAGTAAMTTGFAIGGSSLIGASALLGQMGMVLGSTAAAFLLVQLIFRREEFADLTFTMTSGLIAALLLPAAIVYAKVPWLVLPLVALIPLISIYPFADEENVWKNTAYLVMTIAVPVGIAFYLTWQSAGALLL
jgi:hypothetical protein